MVVNDRGEEVEAKYRITCTVDSIMEKLPRLGAIYKEAVDEEDTYFQHPCRDFSETDEALRIRRMVRNGLEKWVLTYKGPRQMIGEVKIREEIEAELQDPEKFRRILEKLGFMEVATIAKKRLVYSYDGCEILIDHVNGLGKFLEIECKDRNKIDIIRKPLSNCLEPVYKTYLELYMEKGGDV